MCTRLSTKLSRMSIAELAHEYALMSVNQRLGAGNSYDKFSLMALNQFSIRQEMLRRLDDDRVDEAIANARTTLQLVGLG